MEGSIGKLSRGEKILIERARNGEIADLSDIKDEGLTIRADVIRCLMLNLPLFGNDGQDIRLASPGIRIKGAFILGSLRLEYASYSGVVPIIPIILEECIIPDGIELSYGHLSGLSLKNSRITYLSAVGSRIDGYVDLSGLSSIALEEGVSLENSSSCWLDLRGVRITGDLKVSESKLFLPHSKRGRDLVSEGFRYALDLSGACIEGNVSLQPGFHADGGVSIRDAQISGDLWACGVEITAGDGDALHAQSVKIGGSLVLTPLNVSKRDTMPCVLRGEVSFFGAHISGGLYLSGTQIQVAPERKSTCLQLANAFVGYSIFLNAHSGLEKGENELFPFQIQGSVELHNVECLRSIDFASAQISNSRYSILAINAKVGNDFLVRKSNFKSGTERFFADGAINLTGILIGGNLELSGADLVSSEFSSGFSLNRARVNGDVIFEPTICGKATFEGSHFGGNVRLGSSEEALRLKFGGSTAPGLSLEGAKVSGTLRVRNLIFDSVTGSSNDRKSLELLNHLISDHRLKSARSINLDFYRGWHLVEMSFETDDGLSIVSLLWNNKDKCIPLTGKPAPIHSLNSQGFLRLQNTSNALNYLRFFTSHVWGPEGAFQIIESPESLETEPLNSKPSFEPLTIKEDGDVYRATATVHYGSALFHSKFIIERTGSVSMSDDELIASLPSRIIFASPFRRSREPTPTHSDWPLSPILPGNWSTFDAENITKTIFRPIKLTEWPRATINLRGLTIGTLDDENGRGWGLNVRMILDGISIDRIIVVSGDVLAPFSQLSNIKNNFWRQFSSLPIVKKILLLIFITIFLVSVKISSILFWATRPILKIVTTIIGYLCSKLRRLTKPPLIARLFYANKLEWGYKFASPWKWRIWWLSLQYNDFVPNKFEYTPQPYRELTKVYSKQGHIDEAIKLTSLRLSIDRQLNLNWMFKPFSVLYYVGFNYGLSPLRALLTLIICITIGALGVDYANRKGLLIVDITPTASQVILEPGDTKTSPRLSLGIPVTDVTSARGIIPCGDLISPVLYAADVFLPLLDLRQEIRCQIRPFDPALDERVLQEGIEMVSNYAHLAELRVEFYAWINALITAPRTWLFFHSLYALVGWIVTSLVILTLSGILRRYAEEYQ